MTNSVRKSPAKILVVDDEPDLEVALSRNFAKQIKECRYEFIFVRNGQQALEQVKKNHFNLALVDIILDNDEIDGLTLIDLFNQKKLDFKSIVLSAFGNDVEYLKRSFEVGACDFIPKNTPTKELKERLERQLSPKLIQIEKTNESQEREKKSQYNHIKKISHQLNLNLRYELAFDLIKTFDLEKFNDLSENLTILEEAVKEEQKKKEFFIKRDLERKKEGKLPLLPFEEGAIYTKSFEYKSKEGKVSHYSYLYLSLPKSQEEKGRPSCVITSEHLSDSDIRQIIEKKLGKPIDPKFFKKR
jgi:CheY-like chemotaxis protein